MRNTPLVFVGLLLLGLAAPAMSMGEVLDIDCQNSRAIYGLEARHIEHYGCWMDIDGGAGPHSTEWDTRISWSHTSPTLQQLILDFEDGRVVQSHYIYTGGTFELEFRLSNWVTGDNAIGSAVMPILSMDVFADERQIDYGRVQFFATLGAGTLDPRIADILGVGRNVVGGILRDPFLGRRAYHNSTYLDSYREASEGGPTLYLEVPEPPFFMLAAVAVAAVRRRRRS